METRTNSVMLVLPFLQPANWQTAWSLTKIKAMYFQTPWSLTTIPFIRDIRRFEESNY
jgi:hypothetical protein